MVALLLSIDVYKRQFHVFYMDTAHFHTGIEQEDAGSQYQVVEVAEVGEEVAVKVHLALSAGSLSLIHI